MGNSYCNECSWTGPADNLRYGPEPNEYKICPECDSANTEDVELEDEEMEIK